MLSSNPSIYIVELAGTELEIGEFIASIGACGEIIEVVRSGVLGIASCAQPASVSAQARRFAGFRKN